MFIFSSRLSLTEYYDCAWDDTAMAGCGAAAHAAGDGEGLDHFREVYQYEYSLCSRQVDSSWPVVEGSRSEVVPTSRCHSRCHIRGHLSVWSRISEGGGRQQRRLNQEKNSERGALPLLPLSLSASFCLHPLFSIHRRAGAFGVAKEDFWQGSLWEDRYKKRGRLSKSISRSLILCPSLCFS